MVAILIEIIWQQKSFVVYADDVGRLCVQHSTNEFSVQITKYWEILAMYLIEIKFASCVQTIHGAFLLPQIYMYIVQIYCPHLLIKVYIRYGFIKYSCPTIINLQLNMFRFLTTRIRGYFCLPLYTLQCSTSE